jgi:hypothetical protein
LFEDEGRSVVFTAISSRWARNKGAEGPEAEAEQRFLFDTVALLAHEHSDSLAEAHQQIKESDSPIGEAGIKEVYDKYTDKELSEAVATKVAEGHLDAVKAKMGITAENEDPYDIRVLSIGEDSQTMGLDAPKPDYDLPYNHPDYQSALQLQDHVSAWKKGLEKRAVEFAQELGRDAIFAPAWVTKVDGKRTLCILSGLAEKIIDPKSIENTSWYDEDNLDRDLAIFEHEYVHTQGGLAVDKGITFGINLEELRAEHFSGNRQGYKDIKGFFQDYGIITGHLVASDAIDPATKGGSTSEVFATIANKVGLDRMLEVVMASPKNYIEQQSNSYVREAYDHIGGFDGVLQRILEDEIAAGNGEEVEKRIDNAAERLANIVNQPGAVLDVEGWAGFRAMSNLHVITDMIAEKAKPKVAAKK